ncbi:MAG TPA: hypothetical protein VMF11_00870 [Candidatus Baltobacteraceae bacterium]|nr:hypothetical protein [Candidatus Baltobacteraceae bacterium]
MQRALPLNNNPGVVILVVVFLIGAAFFAIGTVMVRRERRPRPASPPPQPADAAPFDYFARIDELLERGDAAGIRELEAMRDRNDDPGVRDAADAALMVIRARNPA